MKKPKIKLIVKIVVDAIMLILFSLVMGYHIFDNKVHEIIGISIFVIVIIHIALNIKWYLHIFKGKYNLTRVYKTIINLSLLIFMILIIFSSMIISLHVFKFMNIGNVALGRKLHLVCTIWVFILVSMHLGFHGTMLKRIFFKKKIDGKVLSWVVRIIFFCISIWGIISFINRDLYQPMFNLVEFIFLPFDEPFIKYILEYFSMIILFATVSFYINSGLLYIQETKERKKEK